MTPDLDELKPRAQKLGLHGLVEHWGELTDGEAWMGRLTLWEETERQRRSLERRLRTARVGSFKSMADFDWKWPRRCDREAIEDLLRLRFINESANAILVGPNGVGKSTVAKNVAYQAVMGGHTVRFVTASEMLNELASQDGASALQRRLKRYIQPQLLVIDELGYLSYGNRHARASRAAAGGRSPPPRCPVLARPTPLAPRAPWGTSPTSSTRHVRDARYLSGHGLIALSVASPTSPRS